ncbi:CHAP domain-containing protein [Actinokineospora soli]|uniref:CHAP domain-containing protein n=1 Tax=Actinokineospora soli TaxID=1048753 RepID=A0ABW2TQR5_9PSEU
MARGIHKALLGVLLTAVVVSGAPSASAAPTPAAPAAVTATAVHDDHPELTAAAMAELAGTSDIVRIAKSQVGYKERAGNCTKYHRDCAAWCGIFTHWVWKKAGVSKLPPAGFGRAWVATYWAKWGKDKGLLKRRPAGTRGGNPKAGDVIVYGKPGSLNGHVGIVVKVHANGKLTTVDGNLSNKVVTHTIDPKTKVINGGAVYGYVRPKF